MFNTCRSLETIPLFNTASVTNMSAMFSNCTSLHYIPELNFSNVSSVTVSSQGVFNSCINLQYVPVSFKNIKNTVSDISYLFSGCTKLQQAPDFVNTSNWTSISGIFNGCRALNKVPAYNLTNVSTGLSVFNATTVSLSSCDFLNTKIDISYSGALSLDRTAMHNIFNNLGTPATTKTITITGSNAAIANPAYSRSSTTTTGSTTITLADTSSFVNGMQVAGTGISDARSVTFTDTGDLVTLAAHGIADGKLVSFSTITSTTGIATYTMYYVINATTDTFQLSLTAGGAAIALTTNGTGSLLVQTLVTNIVTNTSVTIDVPATASATNTLVYRNLNTQQAVMKNWTVTG
jgi:surface protein